MLTHHKRKYLQKKKNEKKSFAFNQKSYFFPVENTSLYIPVERVISPLSLDSEKLNIA